MVGIIVALPSEAKYVLENVIEKKEFLINGKKFYQGKLFDKEVIFALSGIGKVNSAITTQMLIDRFAPEYVLNFGTVGGVDATVTALSYYAVDKAIQYDFDLTDLEDVPLGYIQDFDRAFFTANTDGLDFLEKRSLATADKFTNKENDVALLKELGCSLCDMEGCAIAQVCLCCNVPLYIVKAVSDVHGSGLQSQQFVLNLEAVAKGYPAIIKKVLNEVE